MADPRGFLGRGMAFPFRFTRKSGGVSAFGAVTQSESDQHIIESILQILGIRVGSRVMRRSFGSYLREIVFRPNDPALDAKVEYAVKGAIERWEPRVVVDTLVIDRTFRQEGRLDVSVTYTVIKTNVKRNLVFPYFLDPAEQEAWVTDAQSTAQFG